MIRGSLESGRQIGDSLVLEEHLRGEREPDLGRRVEDLEDLDRGPAQLEEVLAIPTRSRPSTRAQIAAS